MAGNELIENDEDEDVVDAAPEEGGEDEEHEDARFSEADDGDEPEEEAGESPKRKKRLKRRQVQKIAKEAAQRELQLLREQNELMAKRLAAVEGNTLQQNIVNIDQRLNETASEIQQAENIMARAIEAGNGADVAAALRLRDDAQKRLQLLNEAKHQVERAQTAPDTTVATYAKQWMDANPWYNPKGVDEASIATKSIDARLTAEGYDPRSLAYWTELTSRVSARLGKDETVKKSEKKKAPPMGGTREHAPQSTKKEVSVTPERKQAMIDAGIWDDPTRRNQMLKAYQAYDRNSAR